MKKYVKNSFGIVSKSALKPNKNEKFYKIGCRKYEKRNSDRFMNKKIKCKVSIYSNIHHIHQTHLAISFISIQILMFFS